MGTSDIFVVTYVTEYFDTMVLAAFTTEEAAQRYVEQQQENSVNCEVSPTELHDGVEDD